jgi:hypothetical protein
MARTTSEQAAYRLGVSHGEISNTGQHNPYSAGTVEHLAYEEGYESGRGNWDWKQDQRISQHERSWHRYDDRDDELD